MKKVVYVERQLTEWVSIEKVFRQVADKLDSSLFQTSFEKAPFGNSLSGIIRNLLSFRPTEADLYHITGHIHYMALVLPPERTVMTIHDLRFVNNQKGIRGFVLKKLFLDLPLRRLKHVTAISEATRQEIASRAGIDPEKIHVIENPLRSEFVFRRDKPFDDTCPVILQVGTMANKNIPNLIRAVSSLRCKLVIIGRINDEVTEMLRTHKIDFENKLDLGDAELVMEYERCDLVAFCSTYEGFGLPIIEAQALRKPVVTSDLSPMKEVAGNGAMLVDPNDVESIRAGITKVIGEPDLRNSLIEEGIENVKRFSADTIAAQYAGYYNSILSGR